MPIQKDKFDKINKINSILPNYSRVIFESFDSMYLGEGETTLRNYLTSFCHDKEIEFVNQYFLLSITEPELSKNYLDNFNCYKLRKNIIYNTIQKLGVSHIICFSNKMEMLLKNHKKIFSLEKKYNNEIFKLFNLSFEKITIFKLNNNPSIIEPSTNYKINKNELIVKADKKQDYYIKYRYHKNFVAYQNGIKIKVNYYKPFKSLPLKFLRVKSCDKANLIIRFEN